MNRRNPSRFSRVPGTLSAIFLTCVVISTTQAQQYYPPANGGSGTYAAPQTGTPPAYNPGAAYGQPTGPSTAPYSPAPTAAPGTGYPSGYTPAPAAAPPVTGGYPPGYAPPPGGVPAAQPAKQPQVTPAPYQLTEEQQREIDALLQRWEQFSLSVNSFRAEFHRFRYIIAFDDPNKFNKFLDRGELHYQSPDRGMFMVTDSKKEEKVEKWICDGKSIYEYKYRQNEIHQHELPEHMRGKGITQGPLPFLFGASAATLKNRYHLRRVSAQSAKLQRGQFMIEALPKTVDDAQEFQRAEMIITLAPDVRPVAIKLYKANAEQHSYLFISETMQVNKMQFIPSSWTPTAGERMNMKLIPIQNER